MKKIIPFEKELLFKTKVCEITSISLEHKINKIEDDLISGLFHISGDYKMTEGSINREKFSYDVNFDIALDSRYDTKNMVIDIDDFTYQIVNDEILKVNIDMFIDGDIIKKDEIFEIKKENNKEEILVSNENTDLSEINLVDLRNKSNDEKSNDDINVPEIKNNEQQVDINIFDTIDNNETYATYYVYIVKEEDNIEKVIEKYNVSREILYAYNNIEDIKVGDKIIIPTVFNG